MKMIFASLSLTMFLLGWFALDSSKQTASFKDSTTGSIDQIGKMNFRRFAHTSTLLPDGKVLITGGQDGGALSSAEIYDPTSRTFTVIANMNASRAGHTATLLRNGTVLIAGGYNGDYLSSAEIYNPHTGTFEQIAPMTSPRSGHVAVLLSNGKVLLAGGLGIGWSFLSNAEIYDPQTRTFSSTGDMMVARESHTATLLKDGKVLITGGHKGRRQAITVYSSAEIYDPLTGKFSYTGDMTVRRHKHDVALLSDGKVLIVGGSDERDREGAYRSAEFYDPATARFTPCASMNETRYKLQGTSILLPGGKVLIVGGSTVAELYDPELDRFTNIKGSMRTDRLFAAATLLRGGQVLISGGYDEDMITSPNAWLYKR